MKKGKKGATNFLQLGANHMEKLKGGRWIQYTDEDGKVIIVWI